MIGHCCPRYRRRCRPCHCEQAPCGVEFVDCQCSPSWSQQSLPRHQQTQPRAAEGPHTRQTMHYTRDARKRMQQTLSTRTFCASWCAASETQQMYSVVSRDCGSSKNVDWSPLHQLGVGRGYLHSVHLGCTDVITVRDCMLWLVCMRFPAGQFAFTVPRLEGESYNTIPIPHSDCLLQHRSQPSAYTSSGVNPMCSIAFSSVASKSSGSMKNG